MSNQVDYDGFDLISPLGGKFRYYYKNNHYYRKALDAKARLTQEEEVKEVSRSVYDFAYRKATKTDGVRR